MSCIQQNFPSKFEPYDAFYEKLEQNTFVAFILRHPVVIKLTISTSQKSFKLKYEGFHRMIFSMLKWLFEKNIIVYSDPTQSGCPTKLVL